MKIYQITSDTLTGRTDFDEAEYEFFTKKRDAIQRYKQIINESVSFLENDYDEEVIEDDGLSLTLSVLEISKFDTISLLSRRCDSTTTIYSYDQNDKQTWLQTGSA